MATTIVELTGDEKRLIRSFENIAEYDRRLERQFNEIGDAGERAGQRTGDSLEKGSRRGISEADKLLRELRKIGPEGGKISRKLQEEWAEQGKHGKRSVGTIIDEIEKMDPEAARTARAMRREFAQATSKTKTDVQSLGGELKRLVGPEGLKQLASYAAGWLSIQGAIGLVQGAVSRVHDEQTKAIDSLSNTQDPNRRLIQVAEDTADYQSLVRTADRLAMDYGLDRNESRQLVFSARSESFEGDLSTLARYRQAVDTESQASLAGSLGKLFKDEGLSVEQRLSGVLAAAGQSKFDFEQVGKSVQKSSAQSTQAGSDMAETLAANVTLANLIGESAGDRVKAFASKVSLDTGEGGLAGKGLLEAVVALQEMSEADRREFLKDNAEVNEAYTLLSSNLEEFQSVTQAVRDDIQATAGGGGVLETRVRIAEEDPFIQADLRRRKAANAREIANERQSAIAEANRLARRDLNAAGAKNRGQSEYEIQAGEMADDLFRNFGLDETGASVGEAIVGGDLATLQRSASTAANEFGPSGGRVFRILNAAALGANQLQKRDAVADPGEMGVLTRDQTAQFLGIVSGGTVDPNVITEELQRAVTKQIRDFAEAAPERSTWSFLFRGDAARGDAAALLSARVDKTDLLLEALDRANLLAEQQLEASQRSASASEETAGNTAPDRKPPPNYSAGLEAGAAAAAAP